ncbi:MAG: ATP-binding cassette domain-containing protein [Bacteroidales bacterium]|nr:ATP-binding cassette domain-containing protein [Bacteroidales bacterium]
MIKISNLSFSYGSKSVLKNISMELSDGGIYGLLGENGVGKTTLLTLLAGLKKPKMGWISVDGAAPSDRLPSMLSDMYYLPDEVAPVRAKASDFASETGVFYPRFSKEKFLEIMAEFETDPLQRMDTMSAGQLKKTYIAFALATGVKHYLMDEPTNGLDIPSKTQFRKAVMRHTPDDSILVISTHQVRDLEDIIDPVIILDREEVLLNASLQQISDKLFFDYGREIRPEALYLEQTPGGCIQVYPNTGDKESKVNLEALFNTVHKHKELVSSMFNTK